MFSKRKEKEFKIEIVASVIENKILIIEESQRKIHEFEKEIYEFCEFITGETVNFGNLYRFGPIISSLIREQYPDMIRLTPVGARDLNINEINSIIDIYKKRFGDKITVKSIKKEITKILKI